MTDVELTIRFLLQIAVILTACRVVGLIAKRLGQAQVVAEMVAGVLLGPSLLGAVFPGVQEYLFPMTATIETPSGPAEIRHPSMSILYATSQLGLVLYMFVVGLEFNVRMLRELKSSAAFVSVAGIVAPFTLGGGLALIFAGCAELFNEGISDWVGALYMGAAMCITAFPMLARILYENRIAQTPVGTLALAGGAMNDAFAWGLLAVVLAATAGSAQVALIAIGGGVIFGLVMATLGRRGLRLLGSWTEREGRVTPPILAVSFIVLVLGAWYTDSIGIYAVFGAFVVGACMPRGTFSEQVRGYCDNLTTVLLLPLFFVFSGLNTKVGLLDSGFLWGITTLIVVVAVAGKGLGCMFAARLAGSSWKDAAVIGALMNARGLMELIILNIGLEAGVITPTLFTMMVIMAIVTTLMASPLFHLLTGGRFVPAKAVP